MNLNNSRILVTGDTGFLGRNLVKYIQYKYPNVSITGVSRANHFRVNDRYVHEECHIAYQPKRIRYIIDTCTPDIIFHLAGNPNVNQYQCASDMQESLNIIVNILYALPHYCTFLFTSSSSVYGYDYSYSHLEKPFDENRALRPISYYGIAKMTAEQLILKAARDKEFQPIICRLVSQVGPYATHGLVKDLIEKVRQSDTVELLGKYPGSIKPFMATRTTCKVLTKLVEKGAQGTFNICPNDSISVVQVLQEVIEQLNIDIVKTKWDNLDSTSDQLELYMDDSKLKYLLRGKDFNSIEEVRNGIKEILRNEKLVQSN